MKPVLGLIRAAARANRTNGGFFNRENVAAGRIRSFSAKAGAEGDKKAASDSLGDVANGFQAASDAMDGVSKGATQMNAGFSGIAAALKAASNSLKMVEQNTNEIVTTTIPAITKKVDDFIEAENTKVTNFINAQNGKFEEFKKEVGGKAVAAVAGIIAIALIILRYGPTSSLLGWLFMDGLLAKNKEQLQEILKSSTNEIEKEMIQKLLRMQQTFEKLQFEKGHFKESLSLEIETLQLKYSRSFSGSWFFSFASQGYDHLLKLEALTALQKEMIRKNIRGAPTVKDISEETWSLLEKAYGSASLEKDDQEFKDDILVTRMGLSPR